MTIDRDKVAEIHSKGYNCAQVVAYLCRELSGVDEKTALAAMGGFGGGLRSGEVCGAVSGGVYTLGLCFPFDDGNDKEAKDKIARLTKAFTAGFKEEFETLRCVELLQANGKARCEEYMARAIELIHDIIEREKTNGNL
ncbi:MAG: hypothetical protein CVU91_03265 [Firmicutes bacterium HGW-Firmicutes-16]|nr:MAG: hypothetical protein CVU91_03265 [Firmicutes bacterium HGW-Firmicutes-16]